MMAGCCVDDLQFDAVGKVVGKTQKDSLYEGCCDCGWISIGTIKMDEDSGTMPKPKNSLDFIEEHLSKQAYCGYLVGKIYECLYSYVNAGQHEADLDRMDLYVRLLLKRD